MTYAEIEKKIEMIQIDPKSYIGGLQAFASGHKIEMTVTAKRQIASLEKKMAKLVDDSLDD